MTSAEEGLHDAQRLTAWDGLNCRTSRPRRAPPGGALTWDGSAPRRNGDWVDVAGDQVSAGQTAFRMISRALVDVGPVDINSVSPGGRSPYPMLFWERPITQV
jgi:hypothetical protein